MKPNGDVLLGQRPEGKPYAGYWEFPGGKVEAGESIFDALKREFVEELGLQSSSAEPWCGVEHVYPHAHVRLHFYISREWRGEPQSLEGQAFAWQGSGRCRTAAAGDHTVAGMAGRAATSRVTTASAPGT